MSDLTGSALPVAVPTDGGDPAAFYAAFTGAFAAALDSDRVRVWTTDDATQRRLHAVLRGAMRYVDTNQPLIGTENATAPSLVVRTWPQTFVALREGLMSPPIAVVSYEGIDPADVAALLTDRITDSLSDVDPTDLATMIATFTSGGGSLVLVDAGAPFAGTAAATGAPLAGLTRGASIRFWDAEEQPLEPGAALAALEPLATVDLTGHPLLAAVDVDGRLTIACYDENGAPLANGAYTLYLEDGTTRSGLTGADGTLSETGLQGGWAIDFPGTPGFYLDEE